MTSKLQEKHYDDLHDVSKGKKRISWPFNTEFLSSTCISDEEDEKKIEADVPIKVLEIGGVLEKEFTDERTRILYKRINSHNVEQ